MAGVCLPSWGQQFTIASFADNGSWRWDLLHEVQPSPVLTLLAATVPPSPKSGDDYLAWELETDGEFSFASATSVIQYGIDGRSPYANVTLFNEVWKGLVLNGFVLFFGRNFGVL
ncbi:hypothetical protein RIF29_28700 [Crotalaria pallida]|uniref:Uncharacterized protein n=1 Tax=Crotalaria pallida TaxID=3830 RepID=A0AAN9HT73_CROPI